MDARVRNANVLLFRFILPSIVCWLPVQCQTTNIVQRFCQLKEYPYVSLVYTFAACMCALCLCFPPIHLNAQLYVPISLFFVFRRACCLFWNENKFHVLLSLLFFFRIKKITYTKRSLRRFSTLNLNCSLALESIHYSIFLPSKQNDTKGNNKFYCK